MTDTYSDGTEQREPSVVRVKVRETRHGNIASRSEVDAGPGLRGPTDAERKACELHNKILDAIDESAYESADVIADIYVPENGEPTIAWNDDTLAAEFSHICEDCDLPLSLLYDDRESSETDVVCGHCGGNNTRSLHADTERSDNSTENEVK